RQVRVTVRRRHAWAPRASTTGTAHPMHPGGSSAPRGRPMRTAALLAFSLLVPALARAQDTAIVIIPESASTAPHELPKVVAEEAVKFFNAATTTRLVGRTTLPQGNEWRGNVAVRNGSVTLGGRIDGSLLVIDGEVVLDSTAEVTGSITVIGG